MIRNRKGSDGETGAEFYCDVCGSLIPALAAGRAVIAGPVDGEGGGDAVKHVHSGECLAHAETDAHGGWVTLDSHLRALCRNYGMKEVAPPHEGEVDVVL